MKKIIFLTLFFIANLESIAQTDSIFWFAAPAVINAHGDGPVILRLSNPDPSQAVTINISMPAMGAADPIKKILGITSITIPAGGTSNIDLTPILNADPEGLNKLELFPTGDKKESKGIRLQSVDSQKFTVYYENLGSGGTRTNPNGSNAEIMVLKGQNAFGKEFYTPFQSRLPNEFFGNRPYSSVDIVATEPGVTTVTFTPTSPVIKTGSAIPYPANVPISITLNQGETYSVVADTNLPSAHLNGTHIVADKKIAVDTKDDTVKAPN